MLFAYAGATYDNLDKPIGLSQSSVQKHIARFDELGFIERIGSPAAVVFEAPYVEDIVRKVVKGWSRVLSLESTYTARNALRNVEMLEVVRRVYLTRRVTKRLALSVSN